MREIVQGNRIRILPSIDRLNPLIIEIAIIISGIFFFIFIIFTSIPSHLNMIVCEIIIFKYKINLMGIESFANRWLPVSRFYHARVHASSMPNAVT